MVNKHKTVIKKVHIKEATRPQDCPATKTAKIKQIDGNGVVENVNSWSSKAAESVDGNSQYEDPFVSIYVVQQFHS